MKNGRKFAPNRRLRNARLEHRWLQQQLAKLVGTTPVNISRWENGSNFPSPYFRQKLCEVFSRTPAELGLVPTPTSLPHPPGIWTVPFTRNPFFTGREPLLTLLHEQLSTTRMAALVQAQALYGLGGIGKTQTAAEYAFRYGDEYAFVFWVRAAARETLAADFAKLAQLLDLPEKDGQDQLRIAAVRRWLAAYDGWLLILDNADELPLTQEFLPSSHRGYVLYTTRDQAAGEIAACLEVEKLTLRDSTLLLLRRSKRLGRNSPLEQARAEDRAAAEHIAQEMDGLPLALVQAAAYVEETGCSLQDYLGLYAVRHKELLAQHGLLLRDYPDTVATTWSLSFQRVEQQNPAAADVLRLCAFLAPDAIPEELLMRGLAEPPGAYPESEARDPYKLDKALAVLLRYSLVQREDNTHVLSVHRLVQNVLLESMDQETWRKWTEHTVRVVNAALPEASSLSSENQQFYLRYYLPHAQECATLIAQNHLHFPEAARLLFQAGDLLYLHGYYSQSEALHHQALTIRKQVFGSEHPAVADSLTALAILASNQGEYEQAEWHYEQALAIREKSFGPDHPETSRSRNNLGVIYRREGKFEQAEQLFQRALSISEQTLGREHLDTLMIVINLAQLYRQQSRFEQAEHLFRQALTTGERVLGPEHPLIAHNLNLLARLSSERGDLGQAESLWKRSLAIFEKTLGFEHPATAERLNDLAELYVTQQRYQQALSFCQRALNIYEKVLGPAHPNTISGREHLTRIVIKLKGEQGNSELAEKYWLRSISIREKAYGSEHPAVVESLNDLAQFYFAQGDYVQAQSFYLRALNICEKTFGLEHPTTAAMLNSLAVLYETTGKYDQAEPLYQQALMIRQQALGEEDPFVAESLNNLAELYRCKGSYDQAETLFLKALAIRKRLRGDQHPEIAASLNNLAGLYYAREDYAQAEQLFQEALTISQSVFGKSHPEVALLLNNLAEVSRVQNRYEEAEALFRRVLAIFEATYGPYHPKVATVLNNLASTLQVTEHAEEAEELYRRALDIDLSHFGSDHPNIATDLSNLATLLYRANRFAEAEELYRRALAIDEASLGLEHPVLGIRLNNLASTMLASHHVDEARILLQRASRLLEQGGSHRPLAQEVREKLEALQ